MHKTRNITDFFKPFAQPPAKKRLREDDKTSPDKIFGRQRTCSKSPRVGDAETATSLPSNLPSSSLTSSLTSLDSDVRSEEEEEDEATNVLRETDRMPVTASFGTSSSQGPVLTNSQRVMRKGQVMIKNSDDESDSGTSLDDLDELLNLARQTVDSSPPIETDPLPSTSSNQKRLTPVNCVTGRTRSGRDKDPVKPVNILPVMPKYKFSLQSLIAQAEEDDAAEASAMHAKEIVDALDEHRAVREAKHGPARGNNGNASEGLLVSVMEKRGEGESIDRLVQAIQRTEALHQEKSWSFFASAEPISPFKIVDFPLLESLGTWDTILHDEIDRQQAFLDGYVGEVARKGRLPDEILSWIIDATCIESSETLRDAYISTLVDAAYQVTSLITPYRVDLLFRRLTARAEAVDLDRLVIPELQSPSKTNNLPRDWSKLASVLKLIGSIAESMTADARTHILCLLCRLALDASAMNDGHVMIAFEDAFANLIDSAASTQYDHEVLVVLSTVYPQVTDTQLRLRLLRSIPATSTRLNLFRQRLAMAFFYEDSTILMKQPQGLSVISKVAKHLRQSQFTIKEDIDYSELAASVAILDIGLGNGDPPSCIAAIQSQDEFNQEVDRLAKTVKGRFIRIRDSGASHMLRTEAKDVLEALHCRLTYAVRTRQKPKANPFIDPGFEASQLAESGAFMKAFLAKRRGNVQLSLEQA